MSQFNSTRQELKLDVKRTKYRNFFNFYIIFLHYLLIESHKKKHEDCLIESHDEKHEEKNEEKHEESHDEKHEEKHRKKHKESHDEKHEEKHEKKHEEKT